MEIVIGAAAPTTACAAASTTALILALFAVEEPCPLM
jgi:hypothetical protein